MTGDTTLTGRDKVWAYVWKYIVKEPILGSGYGSFWYTADNTMETRTAGIFFNLGEAHNGYLDILLQLGAVGIIAVVVMTAGVLLSISRLPNWGSAGLLKLVAVYLTVTFYLTNVKNRR